MFIKKPLFILIAMCAIMLAACDDSKNAVENAADATKQVVGDAADAVKETTK